MQRDTLLRYLLDELHSYEEDYCDALCPIQERKDASLLGEQHSIEPVTNQALQVMHMSLAGQMQNMRMEITEEIKQNVRTSVTDAVQKSFETVANTRMFPLFSKA